MARRWLRIVRDHLVPHKGNRHHPHLLRRRGLIGVSAFLVAFKGAAIVLPLAVGIATHADEIVIPVTTASVITLGNQVRTQQGLSPLVENPQLMRAAQRKADDMAKRGYFSHASPDGSTALDLIHASGYPVRYAAENLAVHFTNVRDVQRGWMNSPSHRSILLDARYEDAGVGVSTGLFEGRKTTFVVHLFGAKARAVTESPALVTNAVIASSDSVEPAGPGRVLARTFSEERLDPLARELMLYAIALLTALLLLTLVVRFRIQHVASMSNTMLVIGLAFILMLV